MNILRKAKEEGDFIKCVFVLTADPELNVFRVASRVSKGGHDVSIFPNSLWDENALINLII